MVLPEEYDLDYVSILFGAKLVHNTWWIDEPRQIRGINLLPLTPSSTYLGKYPEYVKHFLAKLEEAEEIYESRWKKAEPEDIWQDLFAKYKALEDPQAGYEMWDFWGSFELGDTRSHALQWFATLMEYGTPDFSVSSNSLFHAVFVDEQGQRSYMVYNLQDQAQNVEFSDGVKFVAQSKGLHVHKPEN